ncbi:hypothetical protein HDU91_000530, partial [Kappamyces sp. JEL0680]
MPLESISAIILAMKELVANDWDVRAQIDEWVLEFAEVVERLDQDPVKAAALLDVALKELSVVRPRTPKMLVQHLAYLSSERLHGETAIMQQIKTRSKQLQDIIGLASDHDFFISLAEYEQKTPSSIAIALLERVGAPELMANAISVHLQPFCAKHGLLVDEILAEFCKQGMESCQGLFSSFSTWEPIVLTILTAIQNKNLKYSILLDVMQRTTIPWSKSLESHIQTMLQFTELRSYQESLEQYKLMRLKAMVQTYGINKFNVSDTKLARRLVPFILRNLEATNAVADALQCVEAYSHYTTAEVFIMRSQFLIDAYRTVPFSRLLDQDKERDENEPIAWTRDEKHPAVHELLIWIISKVNRLAEPKCKVSMENFVAVLQCAVRLSSHVNVDEGFDRCLVLTERIGIRVSPRLLHDGGFTLDTMNKVILDSKGANDVFRTGELLGFKRSFIISRSALHIVQQEGNLDKVVSICKDLDKRFPGPETASLILEIVAKLSEQISHPGSALRLARVIAVLCRMAFRNCSKDNMQEILDRFRKIELFTRILMQSDLGDYQQSLQKQSEASKTAAADTKAMRSKSYQDASLVLDSRAILPRLCDFLMESGVAQDSSAKRKGKVLDEESASFSGGFQVGSACLKNRGFQNSNRMGQLLLELELARCRPPPSKVTGLVEDSMCSLLQNLYLRAPDDYKLCFGFMLRVPKEKANALFKNGLATLAHDYRALQRMATIGAVAGSVWNQRMFQVNCLDLVQQTRWMHECQLLEIEFEDSLLRCAPSVGGAQQRQFVPSLLKKTGGDLESVLEFARYYRIEDDYVYIEAIKLLLSKPVVDRERVTAICAQVANKDKLKSVLHDCRLALSPYDYEGIQFIIDILAKHCSDDAVKMDGLVLGMIMEYSRQNPPSEKEL